MPDTTLSGAVMPGTARAPGAAFVSGAGKARKGVGQGAKFDEVIDATTMSIMGSASMQQANASKNVIGDSKDWNAVNTTSMSAQVKSISKDTGAAAAENRTDTNVHREAPDKGGYDKAVSKAGEKLVTETAERMEISEEEVREVMSELNLTEGDLLDQDNLATLVTAIAGEDGVESLITDAGLYEVFTGIAEVAEGLNEELEVTYPMMTEDAGMMAEGVIPEAMTTGETQEAGVVLTDIRTETEAPVTVEEEEIVQVQEEATVDEEAYETGEVTVAQTEDTQTVTTHTQQQTDEQVQDTEAVDAEEAIVTEPSEKEVRPGEADEEAGFGNRRERRDDLSRTMTGNRDVQSTSATQDGNAVMNNILNSLNQTLQSVNEAAPASYTTGAQTVDAQDILRQVVEQMRVSFTDGLTEMEMQLNPESLGRLNVVLSTMRNGDIVAQFTTANESVQTALQSQMTQLLQRFEEQGIKVSSVEVMVDQRAFDSDRDRSFAGQDQRADQEAENRRVGRMRRVSMNLGMMGAEDIAALSGEEREEARRMEAEGATVAYRA